MLTRATLIDRARVIRSKNAGPFELTFDFLFDNNREMHYFYQSLTEQKVASLLHIRADDVLSITSFSPAAAVKVTIRRPRASGDLGETDVYGAQQHIPWVDYEYLVEESQ